MAGSVQVFVASFATEDEAGEVLKKLRAMDRDGTLELVDAAAVVKSAEGKVSFVETADPSGKKWAKRGAIAGGLVGLIFPPSILVSAAVGGAGGGIWGKLRDKGFKDDELKAVGESLTPGSSAIIAVAEDKVVQQLETGLKGYERLTRHLMNADASAAVLAEASSPA